MTEKKKPKRTPDEEKEHHIWKKKIKELEEKRWKELEEDGDWRDSCTGCGDEY